MLIVGGQTTINCDMKILDIIELYDTVSNMFKSLNNIQMSSARFLHIATYIPSPYNQVLIVGGSSNEQNALNTHEIFNASSLSFIGSGTIQSSRVTHTATLLENNIDVLIVGGYSSDEAVNVSNQSIAPCEMFHMNTMSSSIVVDMNVLRAFHTAILLPNTDDVLCCDGVNSNNTALASCERFIP